MSKAPSVHIPREQVVNVRIDGHGQIQVNVNGKAALRLTPDAAREFAKLVYGAAEHISPLQKEKIIRRPKLRPV